MRYITPSGREFVLAHHSLAEWADHTFSALRHLGCSEAYARRAAGEIRQAAKPQAD